MTEHKSTPLAIPTQVKSSLLSSREWADLLCVLGVPRAVTHAFVHSLPHQEAVMDDSRIRGMKDDREALRNQGMQSLPVLD